MVKTMSRTASVSMNFGGVKIPHNAYIMTSSITINILSLAMPIALLQVYDRILPNHTIDTMFMLAGGIVTALLMELFLRIARQRIFSTRSAQYEISESRRAIFHLLDSDIQAFQTHTSGAHMERLNSIASLRDFASGQIMVSLYDIPFVVIYLGIILYIGGILTLVPLVSILAIVLLALPAIRMARTSLLRVAEAEDKRLSFIISLLSGIQSVKAMALEHPLLRRYEKLQERRLGENRSAELSAQHLGEIGQCVVQVAGLLTVGFGSLLVLRGQLSVGGLSACVLLVGRALSPMQNILQLWSRLQQAAIAREQMDALYAMPRERHAMGTADANQTQPRMVLSGLSFGFKPEQEVLSGIDLELSKGEIIALVGPNGSGKTTLLSLMGGFYQPSRGRITLDGLDLDQYDPESVREAIAFLPQQEILFRGTITENITLFRPEYDELALVAAERAGISDLIHALPHGFATFVGDGATEPLPRGLAQRIAVARALIHKPRIILFDDANSAVDDEGDRHLFGLMNELRTECALVLVSHRPAVLKLADRIYRLADGQLDRTLEFAL
ncbi:ATP-binding cassette domain-containing protein [Nitrospirillum amazonense]